MRVSNAVLMQKCQILPDNPKCVIRNCNYFVNVTNFQIAIRVISLSGKGDIASPNNSKETKPTETNLDDLVL